MATFTKLARLNYSKILMLRVGVKNIKRVDVTPLLGWEGGGCNWLYLFVAPQASFNMLQYCIRLGGWVGGGGVQDSHIVSGLMEVGGGL